MPLLSFSGKTSQGNFHSQILEGKKTQTCRKPRKRPIKQGDTLYLYWKSRVPVKDKPVHFIGEATCTKIERKKYCDFAHDDEFARRDGFKDHEELQAWFGDPDEHCEGEYPPYLSSVAYDVIHFSLKNKKKGELNVLECSKCHLPMRKYSTAGKQWYKCVSPYCGYILIKKKKKSKKNEFSI